jgi:hypothetical protein
MVATAQQPIMPAVMPMAIIPILEISVLALAAAEEVVAIFMSRVVFMFSSKKEDCGLANDEWLECFFAFYYALCVPE